MSDEPITVDLDSTSYELLLRYETARRALALWTEEKIKAKDQLVGIMGDAGIGHYAGRKVVTVVRSRPRRFDSEAFKADHPALYDGYLKAPDADEIRLSPAKNLPELPDNFGMIS